MQGKVMKPSNNIKAASGVGVSVPIHLRIPWGIICEDPPFKGAGKLHRDIPASMIRSVISMLDPCTPLSSHPAVPYHLHP